MKGDLIFLDIETSGLNPFVHDIMEVGYIIEAERATRSEVEFSLPFNEAAASPRALEVNGWGQRPFAPRITQSAAAQRMEAHFDGATMVVNSLQFDLGFVSAFLHFSGAENPTPWSHRSVDLKSVTAGKLGIDLRALTTGGIMRHFGLMNEHAHTALGDARFNRDWYRALELYSL